MNYRELFDFYNQLQTADQDKKENAILKILRNEHFFSVLSDIKLRRGSVGSEEELKKLISDIFQIIAQNDLVAFLIEVAKSKHENIDDEILSFNAIQLLGYTNNVDIIQHLIDLLNFPKEWDIGMDYDEVILTAIARIGGKEALKFLKSALNNSKIERNNLISALNAFTAYHIPTIISKSSRLDNLTPELFEIVEELLLSKKSSYLDRKNSLHFVNVLENCRIIDMEKKLDIILKALMLAENIEMNLHSLKWQDFDGRLSSPVDILHSGEWLEAKIQLGKNSESIPLLLRELSKINIERDQNYNIIRFVRTLIDILGFVEFNNDKTLKSTVYQELSRLIRIQVYRERALTALLIRWKIWDYPKPIIDDFVDITLDGAFRNLNEETKKTALKFCEQVLFKWGKRYELIGSKEITEVVEYYQDQNLKDRRRIINFLFWIGGVYSLATLNIIRKTEEKELSDFIYSEFKQMLNRGQFKLCRIHTIRKIETLDFCSDCLQSIQWYPFLKEENAKKHKIS
ncbi:MAG: hypothetical protein HGN29_11045 [Asgard group archaeon]|nr:hypothetical protein [Asgard group archaeon]